jgi:conjugative transfer signal peptidase TraF
VPTVRTRAQRFPKGRLARMSASNRQKNWTLIVLSIAIGALGYAAFTPIARRVLFNPSESAPRGFYWLSDPSSYPAGALVVARLPGGVATLADVRRYLPLSVPVLKRIAAEGSDVVCESSGVVRINARIVAYALPRDGRGRQLDSWSGCRSLAADEYYLLGRDSAASFDSRYFGPVTASALVGRAIPLWTW